MLNFSKKIRPSNLGNYALLFSYRQLDNILLLFTNTFVTMYFLQLSNDNILPIGIYNICSVVAIYLVMFLVRNKCKSLHRANLLRVGIILKFVFFLSLILLREQAVHYIYALGILHGLEIGFYCSVYHVFRTDSVTNQQRVKFEGKSIMLKAAVAVIFPFLFGSLIAADGFEKSFLVVLGITIAWIILSFALKDINHPKCKRFDFNKYLKIVRQTPAIKKVLLNRLCYGLTTEGAFSSIVMIFIIRTFSDSFSLGIFTSILGVISCLSGWLFAYRIKRKNYKTTIAVCMIVTIVALVALVINCNVYTIVIYNLAQTVGFTLLGLINDTHADNVANLSVIQREFKVEYFFGSETALVIGRLASQGLFIWLAFSSNNTVVLVFIPLLIALAVSSMRMNSMTERKI